MNLLNQCARTLASARNASLAVVAAACIAASPAHAILFSFSWSADPALDPSILVSPDPTITAVGTMDIDAAPGAAFTLADISNVSIFVSGASITPFTFTFWTDAAGSIAADGLSATFVGAGTHEPFSFLEAGGRFFGCERTDCLNSDGTQGEIFVRDISGIGARLFYTSGVAALSSMHLVAVRSVPLPGTLPLLLAGLALALVARRAAR